MMNTYVCIWTFTAKENSLISLPYRDVDAVTDIPPAFWFEEIFEAFPDAKVIFSLRDNEEVWAESWGNENKMMRSFLLRMFVKWPYVIKQRVC